MSSLEPLSQQIEIKKKMLQLLYNNEGIWDMTDVTKLAETAANQLNLFEGESTRLIPKWVYGLASNVWEEEGRRLLYECDDGVTASPEGFGWQCTHCGKWSLTRYGFDKNGKRVADYGYDESCMMNSILVKKG